ncbi:MAG: MFS transporter [Deltaproteobacteria bacterium]|jgi:MFS family permease|nr:MFS transporter [Deltaproteobacteria bacterium]
MLYEKTKVRLVISLGLSQTIGWASSYYLPAVLARSMAESLGYSVSKVYAAFSLALIIAALVAPLAGWCIDKWGGKRVLVASNVWFALSLFFLSRAQSEVHLFLGWSSLGLAMGAGLYDMAFATVVRSYGPASPPIITGITLLAGLASTVGWPVSHYFLINFSWQTALLVWAVVHLGLALPLNLSLVLPQLPEGLKSPGMETLSTHEPQRSRVSAMFVLALAFVFISFCTGAMASHMLGLLQIFGVGVATSVLAGLTLGPSQVIARLLHLFALQGLRPINTAIMAVLIFPIGSVFLILFGPVAAMFVGVTHGFGNGIMTIIKGSLPLSIFGKKGYGHRQGLLFLPSGIAQAFSPFIFSICIDNFGQAAIYTYLAAILLATLFFIRLKGLVYPKGS